MNFIFEEDDEEYFVEIHLTEKDLEAINNRQPINKSFSDVIEGKPVNVLVRRTQCR